MYFKITNKDSEVYKLLHALRTDELRMDKENIEAINARTGLKWNSAITFHGQQNVHRTTRYLGFKFTEPEKVDLKIWKADVKNHDCFVPYLKSRKGRDMRDFLINMECSFYGKVFKILKVKHAFKFTFPYVEIVDDILLIYLKDEEPKDENLIEITTLEFRELIGWEAPKVKPRAAVNAA
jgi:hypothetical protein